MGFPQDLIDTVMLHLDRLPPTDEPRAFDATRMRDDILSANSEWDAASVTAAIKELATKGGVDPVGI